MSSSEKKGASSSDIKLRPDGWKQFERAVDAAVKGGPKHKSAKEQAKVAPSKKPSKAKGC